MAAAGAAAPDSSTFLASRFLEGFSHLLIVVCAPALMAMHAAPRDRPVVLSLWGCFFGVGFAATSAAAPMIIMWGGWRGLMLAHALPMQLLPPPCCFLALPYLPAASCLLPALQAG